MIPKDLQADFLRAIYLLPLALLFAFLLWFSFLSKKRTLAKFACEKTLPKILHFKETPFQRFFYGLCLCLAWALATIALMQFKGNFRYQPALDGFSKTVSEKQLSSTEEYPVRKRTLHDIIFLLDTSASMSVKDTRTKTTRLEQAKEIIDEVVQSLYGETVMLIAFTAETTVITPPTTDYLYFRMMLSDVGINEGDVAGTDLLNALDSIRQKYFRKSAQKIKTLILLSDGGDTHYANLQGKEKEQMKAALLEQASQVENGEVFSIGLGTQKGEIIPGLLFEGKPVVSTLDEDLLKEISTAGKGTYFFANNYSSLELAQKINTLIEKKQSYFEEKEKEKLSQIEKILEKEGSLIYNLYFQIPLGGAIFFLTLALLISKLHFKKRLPI